MDDEITLTFEEEMILGFEQCSAEVQAPIRAEAREAGIDVFDYFVLQLEKAHGCDQTQA